MYVVGLTGGIGSGKSTVADLFVARGAALVDTDALAHELTAPGGGAMPALMARFGQEVVRADGGLDRAVMRRRVFADPLEKQALEAILHPLIRAESDRRCAAATAPYVILAVPLLVESGSYRALRPHPRRRLRPGGAGGASWPAAPAGVRGARHYRHPGDACRTTGRGGRCHRQQWGPGGAFGGWSMPCITFSPPPP